MKYIVVKNFNDIGCIAFGTDIASKFLSLSEYIEDLCGEQLQVVVLNNPDVYGEYKPYKIIENELNFIQEVFNLVSCSKLSKQQVLN